MKIRQIVFRHSRCDKRYPIKRDYQQALSYFSSSHKRCNPYTSALFPWFSKFHCTIQICTIISRIVRKSSGRFLLCARFLTFARLRSSSPSNRPWRPREGVGLTLYSFFNLRSRWRRVVNPTFWPLSPKKETHYPLARRLYRSHSRSGRVRKISPHRDLIRGPSSP